MKHSSFKIPSVCLVPLLFLILCLHLKFATGPYYLGNNNDPAYLYLVNSLYILDGLSPDFIQHPGTTLQLLGAIVIRCTAGFVPFSQLLENVYKKPEFFLHVLYYSILALNVVALFALGRYILLKSGRVLWAVLVQSPVFIICAWNWQGVSHGDIPVVANVNAENLFIAITAVYGLLLLKLYYAQKEGDLKFAGNRSACVFGFVGALGVVTKPLFLAWALAPLFLLKSWKERSVFFLALVASVSILTVPIWPNIDHLISWYSTALTHTGNHGAGSAGIVDFSILGDNFRNIVSQDAIFSAVYFIIAFRVIWALFKKYIGRIEDAADDLALRFTAVMCLATLVTILFIVRQHAEHYLVPTVNLLGVLCFFACRTWSIAWKSMYAGLIVFVIFNLALTLMAATKLAQINTENFNFSKKVFNEYKDAVICSYYRSSSPAFSLQFGDENQGHLAYVDVLQKVYPNTVFYHYWNRYFYDGRNIINYVDLKDRFGRIMLYGSRLPENFNRRYIKVREIMTSRTEGLYEVDRVTIEDALKAFYISKELEARQQYAEAYAVAQKAKALGLLTIDDYMNGLLKKIIQGP